MSSEPDPTAPFPVDRRRHPRASSPTDLQFSIPVVTSSEVMDLSVSGALISTTVPLSVGDRARLSVLLGREPFTGWVTVIRAEEGTRSGDVVRHHLGVAFTAIDDNSRAVLARFVRHFPARNPDPTRHSS